MISETEHDYRPLILQKCAFCLFCCVFFCISEHRQHGRTFDGKSKHICKYLVQISYDTHICASHPHLQTCAPLHLSLFHKHKWVTRKRVRGNERASETWENRKTQIKFMEFRISYVFAIRCARNSFLLSELRTQLSIHLEHWQVGNNSFGQQESINFCISFSPVAFFRCLECVVPNSINAYLILPQNL